MPPPPPPPPNYLDSLLTLLAWDNENSKWHKLCRWYFVNAVTFTCVFTLYFCATIQKFEVSKFFFFFFYKLKLLFITDALNVIEKLQQKYIATHLFSTLVIRHISWAANQHIIMISEGSCDTEDWSNDAGNAALITGEICLLSASAF